MRWLLYYGFVVYLAICYLWAISLAVRLYFGKRLRVSLFKRETAAPRTTVSTESTRAEPAVSAPTQLASPNVKAA